MTRTRHACDDSTHMTNFDIETARAMYRITEAYHPDLEAAGLMRVFDGLEAARTHAECLRVAEAETHPLWREYMARLERQQVTQAFRDAGAAYEALHRTGQAETTEGFKALWRCSPPRLNGCETSSAKCCMRQVLYPTPLASIATANPCTPSTMWLTSWASPPTKSEHGLTNWACPMLGQSSTPCSERAANKLLNQSERTKP
jgi:hypothetical protein